jgi:hypothetical protein
MSDICEFKQWKKNNPGLDFVTQNLTISAFIDGCKNDHYDLDPDHQRNIVHNNNWQSDIITSVMRGYSLGCPEFDTTQNSDGIDHFRSLDGKQRLSAIVRFLKNKYSYEGTIEFIKGKKFEKWPKIWQNHLKMSSISIAITKQTLTDEEVTDYFNKKQNTKKTSSGEIFNAVLTKRSNMCKTICANAPFPQKSRDSNKRHTLLESIVRLCYVQHAIGRCNNIIDPNKITLTDFLNKNLDNDEIVFKKYNERIIFVINIISSFREKMQGPWTKTFLWEYLVNTVP